MRGAGCTWNDLTDRDIDANVARTRSRPLPSGQVTPRQAAVWMIAQALAACAILLSFPPLAIGLGVASLALVAIYPFAKRFTWWPQVFLGLAFNWGALLAWAAHARGLAAAPLLLYAAGIAWTLFYDTIYAHQDREDDALIGVRSTARLFGPRTGRWLARLPPRRDRPRRPRRGRGRPATPGPDRRPRRRPRLRGASRLAARPPRHRRRRALPHALPLQPRRRPDPRPPASSQPQFCDRASA